MDAILEKSLERTREDIAVYSSIIEMMELAPGEMNHLYIPTIKNMIRQSQRTIECIETGEPFAASCFTNPAEIFTAMDLHWYFLFKQSFAGGLPNPHMMEDLEALDHMPVASDVCTLIRLALHYLDAGLVPKPTVYLGIVEPCDGIAGVHEAIRTHRSWRDVPSWAPDSIYWDDDASLTYFANEFKEMVKFLTEHTGKKFDLDRLREVVQETNKQYALWQEHAELKRAIPCPHRNMMSMQCFSQTNFEGGGRPEITGWFKDLVADAEMRVKENRPEVASQKIRVLWFDIPPVWFEELFGWLEEEWGAVIVMDMVGYCPYTLIDTKDEDTIFKGFAKRVLMDPPMVRQARGFADNFLNDITRIVRDYKIDCVIWPGHIGHKDGAASISLMRERCRELDVPFLHIGMDQFDKRYMTPEEVKTKISQFFTAMGLG